MLEFGRQSSGAAHTLSGSVEPVSSLMRSELTRGRALAVEVSVFTAARSYPERAVLALGDEHRGLPALAGAAH